MKAVYQGIVLSILFCGAVLAASVGQAAHVSVVSLPGYDLSSGFGVQTDDTLQTVLGTSEAAITVSPGVQFGSADHVADASSGTNSLGNLAITDGSEGVIDMTFGPSYTGGRVLDEVVVTIFGAGDARRFWDFELLYSTVGDESTFTSLYTGNDSSMASGTGTQIRLSDFAGSIPDLHTLRMVTAQAGFSTTIAEIDVNLNTVPEPSAVTMLLGLGITGAIGLLWRRRTAR